MRVCKGGRCHGGCAALMGGSTGGTAWAPPAPRRVHVQGLGPGHRRVLGKSLAQRLGRCPWAEQQFAHRFLLAHKGLAQGSGTQFTPAATATLAAALF